MLIGDKIKNIRELKNYTQQYVASKLDMTQAGYSKIEKGKTRLSIEKLGQLARVLELPIENIITFSGSSCLKENSVYQLKDKSCDVNFDLVKKLYEDKIDLLEKLLSKTDSELQFYKEKYRSA